MEEETKRAAPGPEGVSMRLASIALAVVAALLTATAVILLILTDTSYKRQNEVTERYISCRQYAADMMDASDHLTNMARQFVVTDDRVYLDGYFEELQQTKRRENALENLRAYFDGTETFEYLESALASSNELALTELYAMRLNIESCGFDATTYPVEIRLTELLEKDSALPAAQKGSRAVELVFGDDYEQKKTEIRDSVSGCLDSLIREIRNEQTKSSVRFEGYLRAQTAMTAFLLLTLVAVVVLVNRLVIAPLLKGVNSINADKKISETEGSSEIRLMARIYNAMSDQSKEHRERLSYDATHDDLTDLYNRGVFDEVRETEDLSDIAMILADVDKFKDINDTYGHDTGDRILQKVATGLKKSFRSEDYVCRLGGDEFAVIMVNATSGLKDLVYGKMWRLNEALADTGDGLPPVSLSIGVAFGDRDDPAGDIYKDADTALYRIKEKGGADCGFY